jgi:chemotaxis protein methyltransferase CheR
MSLQHTYGGDPRTNGEPFSEADYQHFADRITALTGVCVHDYKPEQMHRRLVSLAKKAGAASLADYYEIIAQRPDSVDSFWDEMTINVSELFRNPERFDDIKRRILPEIAEARGPEQPVRVWSAGCSTGAEIYSIAIILDELGLIDRAQLTATDIDASILSRARTGAFENRDLRNVTGLRRNRYFVRDGDANLISERLKKPIAFDRHDLLSNDFPRDAFDLIVCRNVVIYFTDTAKERIFRNIYRALAPGGALLIGASERISHAAEMGYVQALPFFYRKPANLPILKLI